MLEHIAFTGTMRLRSDLHIGTGATKKLSELRPDAPARDKDPNVTLVVRDKHGTPIIPATGLKGALRKAIAEGDEALGRLFGAAKDAPWDSDREIGQIGRVWLRFARLTDGGLGGERPFWDPGAGTLITTHVAIERKTGTAADKKLFYVERVPEGAAFELRGIYAGSRAEAERDLPVALGPLARPEGLGIGADGKLGDGRVGFDKDAVLKCTRHYFDPGTGEVEIDAFDLSLSGVTADPAAPIKLLLCCRGPYLTSDPSRRGGNTIPAARRSNAPPVPLLPASSLLGALRSRAAWLAAAEGEQNADDHDDVLTTGESPRRLSRVQRLFGVPGWRGLLRIAGIELQDPPPHPEKLTSIVIDRFSGGTLDSALYATEAFSKVRFAVELQIERRRWSGTEWPSREDREFFGTLMRDLREEGLLLGHAVNRGFGWFEVTQA
jgi:CRISPR/Cas system CSM-associated protein Csm3 (group 7 of RAMP superfamily)